MFNFLNNHREARNPIWDTLLITVTTVIVSALIFSITAASSMTPPQSGYSSTMTTIAVGGQAEIFHNISLTLLAVGLAALPLVICSLVLGQSENSTSSTEQS